VAAFYKLSLMTKAVNELFASAPRTVSSNDQIQSCVWQQLCAIDAICSFEACWSCIESASQLGSNTCRCFLNWFSKEKV